MIAFPLPHFVGFSRRETPTPCAPHWARPAPCDCFWASLVAQLVKNLPEMWGTWIQSLGWEDPLEKERLPTPAFWPGEFHGLYRPWGRKELDMLNDFHFLSLSLFA